MAQKQKPLLVDGLAMCETFMMTTGRPIKNTVHPGLVWVEV